MSKFSEDFFFEILSWLPVSSLLRFRFVCKSWFNLITQNPSFAKSQLLHSNATQIDNPMLLSVIPRYTRTIRSLKYADIASSSSSSSLCYENLIKEHPATLNNFEFVASCNGLVCIIMYETIICLWNPSTEEIKELPLIPYQHPRRRYRLLAFGFGSSCTLDDYKVIRIWECVSTDERYISPYCDVWDDKEENLYLNVYTLRTNSWKRIRDMPCNFRLWEDPNGLHINGGLHWIGSLSFTKSNYGIISFDIEDEEYHEVPKPEGLDGMDNVRLQVLGGCLCVFNFVSGDSLDVWMMKDYGVKDSWTKLFTTTQFRLVKHHSLLKPLWLFKHGEVLMGMEFGQEGLALYDPKCDTFEYIERGSIGYGCDTITYIESLVSLESGTYACQYITSLKEKKRTKKKRNKKKRIVSTDSLTIGS